MLGQDIQGDSRIGLEGTKKNDRMGHRGIIATLFDKIGGDDNTKISRYQAEKDCGQSGGG